MSACVCPGGNGECICGNGDVCAECGAPVFAEIQCGGKSVPLCYAHYDAKAIPAQPPFLLGREAAVRLVKAARAVVPAESVMELPAGYTMVRSTLLLELHDAIPEIAL